MGPLPNGLLSMRFRDDNFAEWNRTFSCFALATCVAVRWRKGYCANSRLLDLKSSVRAPILKMRCIPWPSRSEFNRVFAVISCGIWLASGPATGPNLSLLRSIVAVICRRQLAFVRGFPPLCDRGNRPTCSRGIPDTRHSITRQSPCQFALETTLCHTAHNFPDMVGHPA